MAKTKITNEPQLKFYKKLILNRYLLTRFGVEDLRELCVNLKNPSLEKVDGEGTTGFHKQLLIQFGGKCSISEEKLARYDMNIVSHLSKINEKRVEPIVLKYFQYLSLLFVEYYLDEYFNNTKSLIESLNKYLEDFNDKHPSDKYASYEIKDLNKIAIWNATGSGKTIIMHINYHQYLHYSGGKPLNDATYILLTPKEDLSLQHISAYIASGIPAKIYDKAASRWMQNAFEISILENTKLGDKDQDTIVSVNRFGSKNIVFVDEGHRGSSSGKEGKWQKYRDELCSDGFSFEYSATFGQAIASSSDKSLMERYAKCIIFDYSYKYFYSDGYGKDYNIINMSDVTDKMKRNIYLTGCLMSYYQQKKLYNSQGSEFAAFNIENPLFVFVGASVNAVRFENGRKVSDVLDILLYFQDFIMNSADYIFQIDCIMSGNTGLLDNKSRDIFRNAFPYLTSIGLAPKGIYVDMLKIVFNCSSMESIFHIENLRGVSGEIRLRLGENEPFGVINVGDDTALLNLCAENNLDTGSIEYTDSLFKSIEESDSTINMLIGAKKFTEGWHSWRVSTMGLLNVGRSEGSEIIQLFGRGVRLKGCKMSLKRSSFYKKDYPETVVPKHISILETLNVFGVRADYMRQFKEFLENEGVPGEKGQLLVLKMPVIRNKEFKKTGLYSLRVKGGVDFKTAAAKPQLEFKAGLPVVTLDCYSKVQFESSLTRSTDEVAKNEAVLRPENLEFINYEAIYSELQRYKTEKARHNVNVTRQAVKDLLHNDQWYKLLIPEDELVVHSFDDYKRFGRIAAALLTKYFDRFYYAEQNRWESHVVGYDLVSVDDDNENFLNDEEDKYSISIDDNSENETVILWLSNMIEEVERAKKETRLPNFAIPRQGDVEAISIPAHLYNPLLYLAKGNVEIGISPVALNEDELKFVKSLHKHTSDHAIDFANKELFLIRNRSKKGIGFFNNANFFPDFILWLVSGGKQYITFIDPHGMLREPINSDKVGLYIRIKKDIEKTLTKPNVVLNSFILSRTKYADLPDKSASVEDWNQNHVLFMDDSNYIAELFEAITE